MRVTPLSEVSRHSDYITTLAAFAARVPHAVAPTVPVWDTAPIPIDRVVFTGLCAALSHLTTNPVHVSSWLARK